MFCSGFVQTSSEIALGGAIEPISSGRDQYEIILTLVKVRKQILSSFFIASKCTLSY